MAFLTQASQQWFTRPADERFVSLDEMSKAMNGLCDRSLSFVENTREIVVVPDENDTTNQGLFVYAGDSMLAPTHHSFGQLCSRASPSASPASFFRENSMPAPLVADALNYSLRFRRGAQDNVFVLATDDKLRAMTSATYGRVWNAEIIDLLKDRFGDGVTGDWRVPGEFGKKVTVDRENTTLYASDRDMFVFLANEGHRIEVPDRRDGKSGSLARGFFVWNSEVGDKTLGAGFFLFDYVCCNRIVWGADQFHEFRFRHTKGAFGRWMDQVMPILDKFANGSPKSVQRTIQAARRRKLRTDNLDQFLANRFGRGMVQPIKTAHEADEGRPIETVWDVTVAATAAARSLPNTDRRVEVERAAGRLLQRAG